MNMQTKSPETIGSEVKWYPKAERWCIEIAGSPTLQGVFIKHSTLVGITDVETHDPAIMAGLVQIHRDTIEKCIAAAQMENWHDKYGLLPYSNRLP
jgi:hypothetical protein